MRHTVPALAAAAIIAMSTAVQAQDMMGPTKGLYLGGGLWASIPRDSDLSGGPSTNNSSVELDNSIGFMGALGYGYSNNLRSEIEIGRVGNDVDKVSNATSPSGDVTVWNGMLNLYYDIPGMGRWTPYIGGGLGAANVSADGGATYSGTRVTIDDDDWAMAAQGIAGLGYQLTDNLGLFADYRYFATGDVNLRTSENATTETDFSEHRVMFGLRWFFGAPAKKMEPMPAAAPAPAPAPAPMVQAPPPPPPAPRNYIVFFDFDRSDLKAEAQTVVRQAANGFKSGQGVTRIEATGHADRAGSTAYNQRLSQRRAETVRDELVRQGVPANQITIAAKGETQPLVQTADGVREPQNRRVEIILK